MKKIILILLLIFTTGVYANRSVKFHGPYFRAGWNFCNISMPSLKSGIDLYNADRPWLTDKMEYFGAMRGPAFGFGYEWKGFSMELLWTNHHDIIHAEGIEPLTGLLGKRDIKARFNCWSYALSLSLTRNNIISLGASLDWGRMRFFTRKDTAEYGWLDDNFRVCDRVFLNFEIPFGGSGIHFQVQPYVQLNLIRMFTDQTNQLLRNEQYTTYIESPFTYGAIATFKFGRKH